MIVQQKLDEIDKLHKEIKEIQELCTHPVTTREYAGDNTDEYGRFESSGGYRYHCQLCDKRYYRDD